MIIEIEYRWVSTSNSIVYILSKMSLLLTTCQMTAYDGMFFINTHSCELFSVICAIKFYCAIFSFFPCVSIICMYIQDPGHLMKTDKLNAMHRFTRSCLNGINIQPSFIHTNQVSANSKPRKLEQLLPFSYSSASYPLC